jgi:hypothetical protein
MAKLKTYEVTLPAAPLQVQTDQGKGPAIAGMVDALTAYIRDTIRVIDEQDAPAEPVVVPASEEVEVVEGEDDEPLPRERRIQVYRK